MNGQNALLLPFAYVVPVDPVARTCHEYGTFTPRPLRLSSPASVKGLSKVPLSRIGSLARERNVRPPAVIVIGWVVSLYREGDQIIPF